MLTQGLWYFGLLLVRQKLLASSLIVRSLQIALKAVASALALYGVEMLRLVVPRVRFGSGAELLLQYIHFKQSILIYSQY